LDYQKWHLKNDKTVMLNKYFRKGLIHKKENVDELLFPTEIKFQNIYKDYEVWINKQSLNGEIWIFVSFFQKMIGFQSCVLEL